MKEAVIGKVKSNQNGEFTFALKSKTEYLLVISKESFKNEYIQFITDDNSNVLNKEIELREIKFEADSLLDTINKTPEFSEKEKGNVLILCKGNITSNGSILTGVIVELYKDGRFIESIETKQTGDFSFNLKPNGKYSIIATKYGYYEEQLDLFTNANLIDIPKQMIELKAKAPVKVEGTVMDENKPVENAKVSVSTKNKLVEETTTNKEGKYFLDLVIDEEYTIVASKQGFFQKQSELSTMGKTEGESLSVEVKLDKIQTDKFTEIKNIYFDYNSELLRRESHIELDKLIDFMKVNPEVAIEISSHTDTRGTEDYNMALSKRRSSSVVSYLKYKGIPSIRLVSRAYGETRLVIDSAKSQEEHQLNRRSEFRVVSLDYAAQEAKALSTETVKEEGYKEAVVGQGLVFMIQVGKSKTPLPYGVFDAIEKSVPGIKVSFVEGDDGIIRYMICCYDNIDKAIKDQKQIEKKGFEAFVVAFKDGKKISLDEAAKAKGVKAGEIKTGKGKTETEKPDTIK